ncbi:RDD family protein [Psychromicrobium sp. YIM B11713]|uniref:RDD family protein n=1 Tax=Psychromicrobium sp. YIM B11713 TaxID=3145233 RepID=UPI00374E7564
MSPAALSCRNCGTALAPGASFCTLCGAAVYNRAGRSTQQAAEPADQENARKIQIPGIIPVTPYSRGPLVAPQIDELGEDMARLNLVSASAGKRLAAKLIDAVIPAVLSIVGGIVGVLNISITRINDQDVSVDSTWFLIWYGAASLLSLAYWVLLWIWEARTGKTLGNLLLGLRTTDMKGLRAGVLAIFVRNLIIAIGFAFAVVGGVLVMISNLWDKNAKRQGWQDKAAHTLVFDIKAGRDPLTSGGIDGPASFAPVELPAMMPVNSPVAGNRSAQASSSVQTPDQPVEQPLVISPEPNSGVPGPSSFQAPSGAQPSGTQSVQPLPFPPSGPIPGFEPQQQPSHNPNQWQPPAEPAGPASWAPTPGAPHPDEIAGETKFRPRPSTQSFKLLFDDGRIVDLDGAALIGRNPSGYDGEVIDQLIAVPDESRSISKTHLHVRTADEGLWVTDRQSTNGSAVVSAEGSVNRLVAGDAALAPVGSTVRFGDRSLTVVRA